MNIIIRADSSVEIGSGHIIRCLTLADELKLNKYASNISFICRNETGNLNDFIKKRGYMVYPLPSNINIETDKDLSLEILGRQSSPIDWLIVDHYKIDAAWESSFRKFTRKTMVIDDLSNRVHDCDVLLNQNIGFNDYRSKGIIPDRCIQLLSPKYALLRPQFMHALKKLKERSGNIRRILVFMGGADPSNETCKVLIAIKKLYRPDIFTDVVIGASNTNRNEIERLASSIPNTTLHYNVENMAELMVSADLSIGACGSTSWERCCLGLPTVVITIADNQIRIAEELYKKGAVYYSGWYEEVTEAKLSQDLNTLLENQEVVRQMSLNAMNIVDGKGARRTAEQLYNEIHN